MSSKKNTTKTSRFQLPCTMYSTFDPQHRGPALFSKKINKSSLRKRRSQQLHGLQWTYSPPYSWKHHTAKSAQQKFRPPKETTFSSCTLWVWEYPKKRSKFCVIFFEPCNLWQDLWQDVLLKKVSPACLEKNHPKHETCWNEPRKKPLLLSIILVG